MLHQSAVEVTHTVAYNFGCTDATSGNACVPEMVFIRRADQVEYALGFESITGPTLTTAQFTDAQIAAEAEDLEEDMLDREYHARGMW
jgi:hypothetical protein